MADLEFCEKHNMVAFLKKPTGSEGFQEMVDFLNGSHIRAVDNGEQQIIATVDGKEFTITEASVRRHLQLEGADGISTATVRSVDNGEQQIITTVDGKEFTITEASVRRHLQLEGAD
nr:hypothetical protein [Tanacetum cinerariifolium]